MDPKQWHCCSAWQGNRQAEDFKQMLLVREACRSGLGVCEQARKKGERRDRRKRKEGKREKKKSERERRSEKENETKSQSVAG